MSKDLSLENWASLGGVTPQYPHALPPGLRDANLLVIPKGHQASDRILITPAHLNKWMTHTNQATRFSDPYMKTKKIRDIIHHLEDPDFQTQHEKG